MGGPRAGGAADSHGLAVERRVGHRRERAVLLVADVDEVNRTVSSQRIDHRVEGVAHDAVAPAHARRHQHFPHHVGNCLGHAGSPPRLGSTWQVGTVPEDGRRGYPESGPILHAVISSPSSTPY